MKRGFTLIELMVSVVISGILISAGIAAYRGLADKQKVKQAGISFQTNIKSFQQKALAGEKPAECDGNDTLIGYQVDYLSNSSYSVKAICDIHNPGAAVISLGQGVNFASAFNPGSILFPVLKAQPEGAQTIVVTSAAAESSYQVVIENSGVIRGQMLP